MSAMMQESNAGFHGGHKSDRAEVPSLLTPFPVDNPERSVSLVIPAYNEEDRLGATLESYLPVLERLALPFEVIVIFDGSDNTPSVAKRYANRSVVCHSYDHKLGRGGAIFEGFRLALYSVIAYADADGSVPASDFEKILAAVLTGSPVAIASRRLLPEMVAVPETALRRFMATGWYVLVRVVLGVRVKDSHCGLKVFRRDVVNSIILRRVRVSNRTFEVGMIYHIQSAGIPVTEIPVRYVHDFRTRMPLARALPVMFLTLLGIFLANIVLPKATAASSFLLGLNERFSSI